MTNLFMTHGSSINDERRKMLEKGKWDGFKVKRHERLSNGQYITTDFCAGALFVYGKKLYYTMSSMFSFSIATLFELNTNKKDSSCGVYFEIIN